MSVRVVSLVTGNNVRPKVGDKLKMHYTGFLTNGHKFDSSYDRGDTF